MPDVVAVGECMVEVRHGGDGTTSLSAGGDTYNTAVYLVRAGRGHLGVGYATVIGTDRDSDYLLGAMDAEGLDTSLVERVDERLPGRYLVRVDAAGERCFSYSRDRSAARLLLTTPGTAALLDTLVASRWVYLTGITVAILGPAARERLLAALAKARKSGARVAFDTNYRPALWPDVPSARRAIGPFLAHVDVALTSLDDEHALWGAATPQAAITRLRASGVGEIVVKQGSQGATIATATTTVSVPATPAATVVDTTAAGDAFNGAYLAARAVGATVEGSARCGADLAAHVVGHPGAIAPAVVASPRRS